MTVPKFSLVFLESLGQIGGPESTTRIPEIKQCKKVKLQNCRFPPVFPRGSGLCWGRVSLGSGDCTRMGSVPCKKVKLRRCRQAPFLPVGSTFVLGKMRLCWFDISWKMAFASSSTVCLGRRSGVDNYTGASIEGVVAPWTVVLPSCVVDWPIWAQISTANAAAQELQLWDSNELPLSSLVSNGPKERLCIVFRNILNVVHECPKIVILVQPPLWRVKWAKQQGYLVWHPGWNNKHSVEQPALCYYYTFNAGTCAVKQDQGGFQDKQHHCFVAWNLITFLHCTISI